MEDKKQQQLGNPDIAARLAQCRRSAGYTQKEAAARLGIRQGGLSAMESGKTRLSVEVLMGACRLYGVTSDFILFGIQEKKTDSFLEDLGSMALPYTEVLYNLDRLEDFNNVREINRHIIGLLEYEMEMRYARGEIDDDEE